MIYQDTLVGVNRYTVRYIIPTVISSAARDLGTGTVRYMSVAARSAEDAIRAVLAAHPNADIHSVD